MGVNAGGSESIASVRSGTGASCPASPVAPMIRRNPSRPPGGTGDRRGSPPVAVIEALPNEVRACGLPHVPLQLATDHLLQVGRLRQQKQLVDRADVQILDPPEVHAHPPMT